MMALSIGIAAGMIAAIIEVALVRTYQKNKVILTAIGVHWVAIGLLMPFVELGVSIWLKGALVGVILTIPFIILETEKSRNAVIHISIFAPIWGIFIAYSCDYFV